MKPKRLVVVTRRGLLLGMIVVLSLYVFMSIYTWNRGFVLRQKEAPLDHVLPTLLKPWYSLTCPRIDLTTTASNNTVNEETTSTTNLRSSSSSSSKIDLNDQEKVPFVMIGGREIESVTSVLQSWRKDFPNLQHYSTKEFSAAYQNTRCDKMTWASRLFAVYQDAFQWSLSQTKYDAASHFVFVEDDAFLQDGQALKVELDFAISHNLDYYSFYNPHFKNQQHNPNNNKLSCVYDFGALAQVISRAFMKRLLEVDTDSFCRLPIDMYIAREGPWYVTRRALVKHMGHGARYYPT